MASNYGPNFGARRGSEDLVREGRFKTPVAGPRLVLGTAVEVDPTSAGFLRQVSASGHMRPGATGLLISEDQFVQSIFTPGAGVYYPGFDFYNLNKAPLGKLAVITSGAGSKWWFKNTAQKTVGGRTIPAQIMYLGVPAVGEQLGWTGAVWAVTSNADDAWLEVVSSSATEIEAVLLY